MLPIIQYISVHKLTHNDMRYRKNKGLQNSIAFVAMLAIIAVFFPKILDKLKDTGKKIKEEIL